MKLNAWQITALATLTALSVLAQAPTPPPPPIPVPPPAVSAAPPAPEPAAETPAKPAKKSKPKSRKAKHAKETKEAKEAKAAPATNSVIVLNPPVVASVKCSVLDVRGQGSFAGEVIAHLKKGDSVTVLEEITQAHAHPNEPQQWSRILMPSNTTVWLNGDYVDAATKTVRVRKVNLRGGPGENYSVLGRLEKGSEIKELGKKEGWLEIEAPTNATAFVASEYLEKQAEAPAPAVASAPAPAPEPTPAPAPPVVVNVPAESAPPAPAKPVEATPPPAPVVQTPPPAPTGLVAPAPTAASQADQELAAERKANTTTVPPAPVTPEAGKGEETRIVTREGYVHRAFNIEAPAGFELRDIKTGELIDYLIPVKGQKLKAFLGARVRVTGPESLDPNWPRTPILQTQTVDLMP